MSEYQATPAAAAAPPTTLLRWARQHDAVRQQLDTWLPSFGSQAALLASLLGQEEDVEGVRTRQQLEALLPDMLEDTARMLEEMQQLHQALRAFQLG